MWMINWLCSLKHVLICKRRGGCHRRILAPSISYCPDCGNVYNNGEPIGNDGMTNIERINGAAVMLEWKQYGGDISPSQKIESRGYYLGRIMEMYFSNGMVEFFDGSDQCFSEELTPEQAKDLLRQGIDLIDKHCAPVDSQVK